MKVADRGSAVSRRVMVALGMVLVLASARLSVAQEAGQAPAGPDQFLFMSEAGLIQWQVKADKVADFDSAWVAIRTKLSAAPKPELKALADNLKMYKSEAAPADAPGVGKIVTYYFIVDPAATLSYDPSKLLYESGDLFQRAEADEIFNKLADSLAGIGTVPLKRLQ